MKKDMSLISNILKNGKLKSMSLEGGIGKTGEAHLAVLGNERYMLRVCPDEETAQKYLRHYNQFKKYGFFPELLEMDGRYMLFEFVNGRRCPEKSSPKIVYQVGKICGIINRAPIKHDYQESGRFYKKVANAVKLGAIKKDLARQVEQAYAVYDKKIKLKTALEAGDVTNDNFLVDRKGKVFFVDIEAVKPNIRGYGIAKAFSSWFRTEKEKDAFRRGYDSVNSMGFYNEDYARFVTMVFFLQRINFKFEKGEYPIVAKTISKLEKLVRGVKK